MRRHPVAFLLFFLIFLVISNCQNTGQRQGGTPVSRSPNATPPRSPLSSQEFFAALYQKNIPVIKAWLDSGGDPNAPIGGYAFKEVEGKRLEIKMLPIFLVMTMNNLTIDEKKEILALFKQYGANFNRKDEDGKTLLYALVCGLYNTSNAESLELMRFMLESGADPDLAASGYRFDVIEGKKVPVTEYPLFAIMDDKRFTVSEKAALIELFRRYKTDLNARERRGMPLLEWLVSPLTKVEGKPTLVRALLSAGADPNAGDFFERLLNNPDWDDYLGLLQLALRSGADVRRLYDDGETVFAIAMRAIVSRKVEKIRVKDVFDLFVAAGADLNMTDAKGIPPLFYALECEKADVAWWLLERGVKVNVKDAGGDTVLHVLACSPLTPEKAVIDLARYFVERGVDLDAQDSDGNTALCLAAGDDSKNALLVYLVSCGADFNIGNHEGVTPLSNARRYDALKDLAFLKSKNAIMFSYQFPVNNDTPPCKAVLSGDLEAISSLAPGEFARMAARTSCGVPATALHLAAEQGNPRVIKALCARKVDWNIGDRYGRSPLQLAVLADNAEAVALLLENGADPNFEDNFSVTPFSHACAVNPAASRLLLDRGFIPKGDGPMKSAIYTGNLDLVKTLSRTGKWGPEILDISARIGQIGITEYLSPLMTHGWKTPSQLIEEARKNRAAFDQFQMQAAKPLPAPKRSGGIAKKRGTFLYVVESWSPWMEGMAGIKLSDYPVSIYVPKDYDGRKPFGLLVSMTNAKYSSQYPPAEYTPALDRRHLIWAGFDPYKSPAALSSVSDANEAFSLAIVYNLLGYYNIERSRIYIAGFSLGGQYINKILPKQPHVFKGAIIIGMNYEIGTPPSLYYCQKNLSIVMAAGDYDHCRRIAYESYDSLLAQGFRNVYFIQEPMKTHSLISGASFEKALSLLEMGRK